MAESKQDHRTTGQEFVFLSCFFMSADNLGSAGYNIQYTI